MLKIVVNKLGVTNWARTLAVVDRKLHGITPTTFTREPFVGLLYDDRSKAVGFKL